MTEDQASQMWPVLGRRNGHSKGYARLLCPSHPNSDSEGYVYEHTYVASRILGRGLRRGEVAHHIDGNEANNDNSNLLICNHQYHRQLHVRLAASAAWPEFKPHRPSTRPHCAKCDKRIPYDNASGLCVAHYFESIRQSTKRCSVNGCQSRAGSRSGLCLAHLRYRGNKRRYFKEWDYVRN